MDVLNGRITRIKYCEDCDIYRPPRTIHCGLCGCCIERLDHHCPWIGTCVGKRNYKYFLFFLWSVFLQVCFGIGFGALHITYHLHDGADPKKLTMSQIISIMIMTLAGFLGIFVFFLFGYHQYLLCRNETTNENLKKTSASSAIPSTADASTTCAVFVAGTSGTGNQKRSFYARKKERTVSVRSPISQGSS